MSVTSFWCIIVTNRPLQTYKMKRVDFSISRCPGGSCIFSAVCVITENCLSLKLNLIAYRISFILICLYCCFDLWIIFVWFFYIFSIFGSTGSSKNGHNSTKNITSSNIASYLILECPYHHFDALLSRTDYHSKFGK